MSLVKVQGNASGTGIFTIASPNSNTDRTLNLPDSSGTLVAQSAGGVITAPGGITLGDYQNIGATNNNAGISLTGGSVTNNGAQINLRGGSFSGNTSGLEFITDGTERARIASNGQQSSVIPGGSTLYPEYKCRAWVNFNGTGTVAIRASGNVSSITDNGTGDYTVNFSSSMPDANYATMMSTGNASSGATNMQLRDNTSAPTTSAVRIFNNWNGAGYDQSIVAVAIFR